MSLAWLLFKASRSFYACPAVLCIVEQHVRNDSVSSKICSHKHCSIDLRVGLWYALLAGVQLSTLPRCSEVLNKFLLILCVTRLHFGQKLASRSPAGDMSLLSSRVD